VGQVEPESFAGFPGRLSRRNWLRATTGAMIGGVAGRAGRETIAAEKASNWSWKQLVPHSPGSTTIPVPRDPWNGMLAYKQSLYLFGGVYPRYGPPSGPGDLRTMGSLNDLWRFDLGTGRWHELEADNGQADFDPSAKRPCGRVLPCWAEVDGTFYLFGGLTALARGWKTRLLNDLWSYKPATGSWTLLEPNDGRLLKKAGQVDAARPTADAAMGVAVIGRRIFIYGGWGGDGVRVVLSPQLWSFDIDSRRWTLHGTGTGDARQPWPAKRYCPAVTEFEGRIYLWGGRDTQDLSPQFYNDLWSFDPKTGRWNELARQVKRIEPETRPLSRYGVGQARIGHHWYIFGGFGGETGNSPQLNDLWQLDLRTHRWRQIESHNGGKLTGPTARRPCVRRVPAMMSIGDAVYLFGGLDLTSGQDERGPLIGFNDLWTGRMGQE